MEWVIVIGFIGGGGVTVMWLVDSFAEALAVALRERRFRKDLKAAIKNSQPSWKEVCDIAELCGVGKQTAYLVVRTLLRDLIVGHEDGNWLKAHRTLLEGFVAEYKKEEPFEGLPSETRLSLERIRESLGTNADALHPLTGHFKELLKIHETVNRRQRFYTTGGFLVGLIGLMFGVYVSFYPYTPDSVVNSMSAAQREPANEQRSN
ncbi:hypothetical protein DENIT_20092 [Pseudomonas veronii]|nr:hypothetical protein DENIT_20092 [Pseudomonas veronii]